FDMNWFSHFTEIRLYYLVHAAATQPNAALTRELVQMGLHEFLAALRACDEKFEQNVAAITTDADYRAAVALIPAPTLGLALPKALLSRLGLASLANPRPAREQLPWAEEYT